MFQSCIAATVISLTPMLFSVEQQTNYIYTRELKSTSTKLSSYNIVLLDPTLFSEEQQMNYTGTRELKVFLNS
jgi:hypothetical protein